MADITNKYELKRRIDLFLDELDYSINEDFCKETMKMMREFIGHANHRLDCEESKVKSLKSKLKNYKDLEKQGLLLRLPCKVGDTVYCIYERYTKCSEYGQVFEEYSCQGCECLECDSHKELYVQSQKAYSLDWIVSNLKRFGKTVFLTQEEAEQRLKEIKSEID